MIEPTAVSVCTKAFARGSVHTSPQSPQIIGIVAGTAAITPPTPFPLPFGQAGFFALNMDPNYSWAATLKVPLPDGVYCDVIASSNCATTVSVAGGSASFNVGTLNAVALHIAAKFN